LLNSIVFRTKYKIQNTIFVFGMKPHFLSIVIVNLRILIFSTIVQPSFQTVLNFIYTGTVQNFTVPTGVQTVLVDITGAAGGGGSASNGRAGYGARVQSNVVVAPGSVLHIYVGGIGGTDGSNSPGGWNGGGIGHYGGSGGGGASDIRMGGTRLSNRIIVAGAGGGYFTINCGNNNIGGDGGVVGTAGTASNCGCCSGASSASGLLNPLVVLWVERPVARLLVHSAAPEHLGMVGIR
jgi:hypothetical protein